MSSAFYPLGMKSYNNHVPQGGYVSWKGTGVFSNPVGITSSNIRPLTNLDPGNVFPTGFGLPRPIKHYRKGRVIPYYNNFVSDGESDTAKAERLQIEYNTNRMVKSSYGASLSGGSGGMGILNQMIDRPGSYIVKLNAPEERNNIEKLNKDCTSCQGFGIVANYYPNNRYLTDNPDKSTTNTPLCCNEEKKARKRVLPASTLLKKNYYTTLQQYRQNRCQTYDQRIFNFETTSPYNIADDSFKGLIDKLTVKPGSPLSLLNMYVANCYPNSEIYAASEMNLVDRLLILLKNKSILTPQEIIAFSKAFLSPTLEILYNYLTSIADETTKREALLIFVDFVNNPYYGVPIEGPSNPKGCKLVVYKPNNYQYAQQGAVSSSTRILKLDTTAIETNAASFKKSAVNTTINLNTGSIPITPFILKQKTPTCNNPPIIQFQNKKACVNVLQNNFNNLPIRNPFRSNHYAQSPYGPLL